MRRTTSLLIAALFAVNIAAGCASHTTERRETVEYPADAAAGDSPRIVEERSTETTDTHEHRGVLGTTVDFIGDVIAFPFRLIGSVINAIF